MKYAIQVLKMEAQTRRSMSTPNANTITEYTAKENAKRADECDFAVALIQKAQDAGFVEGWLEGINAWAKSYETKKREESA